MDHNMFAGLISGLRTREHDRKRTREHDGNFFSSNRLSFKRNVHYASESSGQSTSQGVETLVSRQLPGLATVQCTGLINWANALG